MLTSHADYDSTIDLARYVREGNTKRVGLNGSSSAYTLSFPLVWFWMVVFG